MAAAAMCDESSEDSDCISETPSSSKVFTRVNNPVKVKSKYSELQQNSVSSENEHDPLLLPTFLPTCTDVKVNVEGVDDDIFKTATKVSASKYITSMFEENNDTGNLLLHYRDKIEDLQSKNRKLHCVMNDRTDIVRNLWRNSILEGNTRGAMCVKKALSNVVRQV